MRRSELPETGGEEGRGARLVLGAVVLIWLGAVCPHCARILLPPRRWQNVSIHPNARFSQKPRPRRSLHP